MLEAANLTNADLRLAVYDVDTCLKFGFLKAPQSWPPRASPCPCSGSGFMRCGPISCYQSDAVPSASRVQDAKVGAVDWRGKSLQGASMPGVDLQVPGAMTWPLGLRAMQGPFGLRAMHSAGLNVARPWMCVM